MDVWQTCRDFVSDYEGGFQNQPDDPGNWTGGQVGKGELKGTKYGISAASYPDLEIESLTQDQAFAIYKRDYFDVLRCGEMPIRFALVAFDGAILQGADSTAFCLQRALGVAQDGKVGQITLGAVGTADLQPDDHALELFLAERAVAEDKILAARPAMLAWADNWEFRMFKLARMVFGTTLKGG